MKDSSWGETFRAAYERVKRAYEEGAGTPDTCVSREDGEFLAEIGCSAQELFDLVEDDVTVGEPGLEKAIGITRVRYEYFQEVEQGRAPERLCRITDFPPPGATLGGVHWLPRIIAKARAKLTGELPPELMYCCGGDRHFLQEHGLEPDAFLRAVWKAGDRETEILEFVRRRGAA